VPVSATKVELLVTPNRPSSCRKKEVTEIQPQG
jgi:hypothetical protein